MVAVTRRLQQVNYSQRIGAFVALPQAANSLLTRNELLRAM